MNDLYKTGRNSGMYGGILPQKGNVPVGMPLGEKVVMLRDGYIHLRGPPIAVYHPEQYDSYTYRCKDGATHETMKYGIVGIKNLQLDAWVTDEIAWIDPTRTTIKMGSTDPFISSSSTVDDELIVYYLADSSVSGGHMNNVVGFPLVPETFDILTKLLNDAYPSIFTEYGSSGDGSPEFYYSSDAGYRTGVTVSADSVETLIDTTIPTGTFRWDNGSDQYPIIVSEIVLKTSTWFSWPWIDFQIVVDGNPVTGGFGTSSDYVRWIPWDTENYTGAGPFTRHPGQMFGGTDEAIFFDSYLDVDGDLCWRFDLSDLEVTESLIIRVGPSSYDMNAVKTYIRAYYIPT